MAELSTRRILTTAAVAGALAAGVVAGGIAVGTTRGTASGTPPPSSGGGAVSTAVVQRTTLTTTVQVGGAIGYSGSYTVAAARNSATFTWLPAVGNVINEGQRVYAVNDEQVPLLYGRTVAYRAFQVGMSDGADVSELTRDLIALGYGAGLTEGDHYSSATAVAVARWQRALGLPATGKIAYGQVVIEPGPIRVTTVNAYLGGTVGGPVLTATSTHSIVSVDLDVSEEYLVKPGDAVRVVLPDGSSTVGGRITAVGRVATCAGGAGVGLAGGSGGTSGESPCESGGSGNASSATVPVTIALDRAPPGAALDQAPVNVNITTQRAKDVLAVPINALLALAGGGYGVQVVTGGTTRLVGVTTGLYSDTEVQVSGSGISAGTKVVVPAS